MRLEALFDLKRFTLPRYQPFWLALKRGVYVPLKCRVFSRTPPLKWMVSLSAFLRTTSKRAPATRQAQPRLEKTTIPSCRLQSCRYRVGWSLSLGRRFFPSAVVKLAGRGRGGSTGLLGFDVLSDIWISTDGDALCGWASLRLGLFPVR